MQWRRLSCREPNQCCRLQQVRETERQREMGGDGAAVPIGDCISNKAHNHLRIYRSASSGQGALSHKHTHTHACSDICSFVLQSRLFIRRRSVMGTVQLLYIVYRTGAASSALQESVILFSPVTSVFLKALLWAHTHTHTQTPCAPPSSLLFLSALASPSFSHK